MADFCYACISFVQESPLRFQQAIRLLTRLGAIGVPLLAGTAYANPNAGYDPNRILSMQTGIFCRDGVTATPEAADTIKGTVERLDRNPVLVMETTSVPAIDQIMFGVEVRETVENGIVTITVTHPPLGPEGRTSESWETQLDPDGTTVHSYYLGLSDGNPVGRWRIVGSARGRILFEAAFDVVPHGGQGDPCHFMPVS